MNNEIQNGSRANYRAKRKKTNLVLNSLILLVLALIVVVAFVVFSGGKDKTAKKADAKHTEQSDKPEGSSQNNQDQQSQDTTTNSGTDQQSQDSTTASGTDQQSQDNTTTQNGESGSTSDGQSADSANEVVSDGGSTPNVAKTIENPDWKPVGTSQTGKHTAVYDSNSVDWQEMLNAISAGTGIARDNMTIWRLGSNQKDPNHSIATISSKDEKKPYRVYIEWVDGQGWKPTKVEELSVNDKGSSNN